MIKKLTNVINKRTSVTNKRTSVTNKRTGVTNKRSGIAVFALIAMITTAVMFIFLFSQNFLSEVNSQRETIFTGREAMHLAESAINETLLDFKAGMNDPSGSLTEWHDLLRQSLKNNDMIKSKKPIKKERTNIVRL